MRRPACSGHRRPPAYSSRHWRRRVQVTAVRRSHSSCYYYYYYLVLFSEQRLEKFGRFVKSMDDSVKQLNTVCESNAKKHQGRMLFYYYFRTTYCNYCLPAATGYQRFCLFFFLLVSDCAVPLQCLTWECHLNQYMFNNNNNAAAAATATTTTTTTITTTIVG